jgi:hypothetical protein
MSSIGSHLLDRMKALELQLETELACRHARLKIGLENGRIAFEEVALRRHRELKTRLTTYLRQVRPIVVIAVPVIYAIIVSFVLLDLFVSVYQAMASSRMPARLPVERSAMGAQSSTPAGLLARMSSTTASWSMATPGPLVSCQTPLQNDARFAVARKMQHWR